MTKQQEYKSPETPRELLIRWLKRLRESQFAHNEASKNFNRYRYFIGIPSAILSTIVGTSVFASLGKTVDPRMQIIVGLISVLAAVLSALQTILRYSERAELHRSSAANYGSLRRKIEEILVQNKDDSELNSDISSIRQEIDNLAKDAPNFSDRIWGKAINKALNS
jgi:hypothetical protein